MPVTMSCEGKTPPTMPLSLKVVDGDEMDTHAGWLTLRLTRRTD